MESKSASDSTLSSASFFSELEEENRALVALQRVQGCEERKVVEIVERVRDERSCCLKERKRGDRERLAEGRGGGEGGE